jgi:hypothetical protein
MAGVVPPIHAFTMPAMRTRTTTKLIHEGKYAAEVEIGLHYSDESWSPTMSLDDAKKLDAVRLALKRGDVAEAAKHGRIYELKPVAAE